MRPTPHCDRLLRRLVGLTDALPHDEQQDAGRQPFHIGEGLVGEASDQPHQNRSQAQIIKFIRGNVVWQIPDDVHSSIQVQEISSTYEAEKRQRHPPISLAKEDRK